MPNIKSAKKRMRQNTVRRLRNRAARGQMRTEIKRLRTLVAEEKLDDARTLLTSVYSVIDKTAQKGSLHRKTGARYKSRLSQLVNSKSKDS